MSEVTEHYDDGEGDPDEVIEETTLDDPGPGVEVTEEE